MEKRQEILLGQMRTYRNELLQLAKSFTKEEADIIPRGFRNNVRWNLGHVFLDQYSWIQALTKEEAPIPDGFKNWFSYGTTPADFTNKTPEFNELLSLLQAQPDRIFERYADRIDEEYPAIDLGMQTIEQVLVRTIFHEGMHLQAIMDIRKALNS
ncbi:DinB superfamily protein [Terribacillus halophilus]|uniref:DinB superfamily protein n=1 Tax=Terribacillus halophilus TaxID=361279 RepID=A0A1G6KS91_9BACI|nr:DinB family protein [Terribacillus halophilus]SDC33940.1 DinB superfamily protein [Terribacillus halophilus]